jgi:hypothetical protein
VQLKSPLSVHEGLPPLNVPSERPSTCPPLAARTDTRSAVHKRSDSASVPVGPSHTDFLVQHRLGQQCTFQGRSDKVLERQAVGAQLLLDALSRFNISAPVPFPATRSGTIPVRYQLDRNKQVAYSEFLRRSGMRLGDFIRLLRGERAADTSPNKALWVPTEVPSWRSYRFAPQWEDIVQHGVVPEWREVPPAQSTPPPNHGSARRALNMVVKNIRKGQDEDLSHSRH